MEPSFKRHCSRDECKKNYLRRFSSHFSLEIWGMAGQSNIDKEFIFRSVERTNKHALQGDYGEIVELKQYGVSYAATRLYTRMIKNIKQKNFEDALERECCHSSKLCHPNVIRFLGLYYDPCEHSRDSLPLLVTEMVDMTLTSLVEFRRTQFSKAPLYIKLSILLDVCSGLWYLHSQNPPVVHGEFTPSSIFLTGELVAKIGNLGLASVVQPDQTAKDLMTYGHANDFIAPEVQEISQGSNFPKDPSIDIFSYGAVILYAVNQEWPEPLCDKVVKHRFRKKVILSEVERRQKHLDKISGYFAVLKPLVEACMQDDPKERAKMEEINNKMRSLYEPYSRVNKISWRLESGISHAVTSDKITKLHNEIKITQHHLDQQDKLVTLLKV